MKKFLKNSWITRKFFKMLYRKLIDQNYKFLIHFSEFWNFTNLIIRKMDSDLR